jgi:hypothetical protein
VLGNVFRNQPLFEHPLIEEKWLGLVWVILARRFTGHAASVLACLSKPNLLTHAFHYGNHADMESPLISYRRERDISQKDLAEVLGIRTPALCKWERGRVPAARVLDVERATGISRHQLRPDVFGPPAEAAA